MYASAAAGPSSRLLVSHSHHHHHHRLLVARAVNRSLFTRARLQRPLQAAAGGGKSLLIEDEGDDLQEPGGGREDIRAKRISGLDVFEAETEDWRAQGTHGSRELQKNTFESSSRVNGPGSTSRIQREITRRKLISYYDSGEAQQRSRSGIDSQSVDLGTAALGQPVTIRIVRDSERHKRRRVSGPLESESSASKRENGAAEIAALALKPDKDAEPEDVDGIMRIFRSEFFTQRQADGSFSSKDCLAVAMQLYNGLTRGQLANYVRRHQTTLTTTKHDYLAKSFHDKLATRTRYLPNVSKFPEMAMSRLTKRDWKNLPLSNQSIFIGPDCKVKPSTEKAKLVERVLRELWEVRPKHEQNVGELDIRVHNPQHLKLLLKHHDSVFKRVSKELGLKVEIAENVNIVRISGHYTLATEAFRLIYQDLQNVQCKTITVPEALAKAAPAIRDAAVRALSDASFLSQVADLTDTRLHMRERCTPEKIGATMLDIYCLGPSTKGLDDARRLIQQAIDVKDSRKIQVQCELESSNSLPVAMPVESGSTLPLQARRLLWHRWAYANNAQQKQPSTSSSASGRLLYSPKTSRDVAEKTATHLYGSWTNASKPVDQTESPFWQAREERQVYALVGHVAHAVALEERMGQAVESAAVKKTDSLSTNLAESTHRSPRQLISGIPDLWRYMADLGTGPLQVHNQFCICLRAGIAEASEAAKSNGLPGKEQHLPDVEIIVDIDEDKGSLALASVHLVRDWRESELLLPAQAADLRFVARAVVRSGPQIDPALAAFLSQSQLDAFGHGRLQTPSRVKLAIPRWTCVVAPLERASPVVDKQYQQEQEQQQDQNSLSVTSGPEATGPAAAAAAAAAEAVPPSSDQYPIDNLSTESTATASSESSTVQANYYFASLEHHSSISMHYQGHLLRVSTVEGGLAGGRREELRFDLPDTSAGEEEEGSAGVSGHNTEDATTNTHTDPTTTGNASAINNTSASSSVSQLLFFDWFDTVREFISRLSK